MASAGQVQSRSELYTDRYFANPYPDYDESQNLTFLHPNSKVWDFNDEFMEQLDTKLNQLKTQLTDEMERLQDRGDDGTVYTGSPGIAMFFMKVAQFENEPKAKKILKEQVLGFLSPALKRLRGKRMSFLCGDAGPIALAAVVYKRLGDEAKYTKYVEMLKKTYEEVNKTGPSDECLYGRAGILYSYLYVKKECGEDALPDELLRVVARDILKSGEKYSKQFGHKSPLMYSWHSKEYLGAAHGMAGILYILMLAHKFIKDDLLTNLIRPSVDYLETLAFSDGNFPSSRGNESNKLVQWCHGAPGFCAMFIKAAELFPEKEDVYGRAAIRCGQVIWERGLLTKGYGLCHGTGGNAYAFLHLFRKSKDPKDLYRAGMFGTWCLSAGPDSCRTPDRPFSLYEGLAGMGYFLLELKRPEEANFPGYSLF